ncbi:unnamed protein product [Mesocestoides corti]|uniref:Uncharacterized protein n=1 Tax=Mesocestoides corti TaxID=53468 RepID=A0A0R3UNN1_MESCO|nr:unnamed protein product [Mesocestoides corti]
MGPGRVDIRTARKSKPISDKNTSSRHRALRSSRPPSSSSVMRQKKKANKGLVATKITPVKNVHGVSSTEDSKMLDVDNNAKPRRRRVDSSDYIRRRFLYDDDSSQKTSKGKSTKTLKRSASYDLRFRSSTVALMAASSANLQRKRKRIHGKTTLDPSFIHDRKGRRSKPLSPVLNDKLQLSDSHSSADEAESATDEQISPNDGVALATANYPDRHVKMETGGDSHRLLKPLFRKLYKKGSCKQEPAVSPETLQNTPDYIHELPEIFLDDHMTDFTRSRGPVVLSKRARHRIIQRPSPPRTNFIKQMSEYSSREFHELAISDTDEAFRHQVRSNFALDCDSTRVVGGEWSGRLTRTAEPGPSVSIRPQSGVDVEDFAGDLIPQSSVTTHCPSGSGSSRRKSPIRPMQVLRSEPIMYQSDHSGATCATSGAPIIQQRLLAPSFSQSPGSGVTGVSNVQGLVDLCAAAGLDSTATGHSQPSPAPAECGASTGQHTPTLVSSVHSSSYNLVKSNLVSLQPSGRMLVDTSAGQPISGYTVASATPISRISLMPSRCSYGSSQNTRLPQASSGSKSLPVNSGPTSSSNNSGSRRRPTILKRGAVPTPTPSTNQYRKISSHTGIRTLPLISPSTTPHLSPPFMRTALRGAQPSHIAPGVQPSRQPLTYAIVSAAAAGQPGVIAVAPNNRGTAAFPSSQTASSRLFGSRRNANSGTTALETRPVPSSTSSSALTLISCLPTPSVVSCPVQQSVRYAVVRGAGEGKKYVLLGGGTNLGVAGYSKPLKPITTGAEGGDMLHEEPCDVDTALVSSTAPVTPTFYSHTSTAAGNMTTNKNLPSEQAAAIVS